MMLSPEERLRVERTARQQAELAFWQEAFRDGTAGWDGNGYVIRTARLTRDDISFLRTNRISTE
jgi:hypothetical protein